MNRFVTGYQPSPGSSPKPPTGGSSAVQSPALAERRRIVKIIEEFFGEGREYERSLAQELVLRIRKK